MILVAPNARAMSQAHDIMNGFQALDPNWNISVAQTVFNKVDGDEADESDRVFILLSH